MSTGPRGFHQRLGYTVTQRRAVQLPWLYLYRTMRISLAVSSRKRLGRQRRLEPSTTSRLRTLIPSPGPIRITARRNRVTDNKIGERVDFNNRKTGNWSFYYHFDDSTVNSALPEASVPGFPSTTPTRAQEFVISNTKSIGTTAVNEARATFFRTATHLNKPTGGQASLASLGFVTGAGTQGIIPDATPGFPEYVPQLYFNNFAIGTPSLITFQPNNTYTVSDGFSKVVGRHTLKFGGEFRYLQVNERNLASQDGAFVFDGTVTGNDFADYLLGAPTGAGGGFTQAALQLLDSRTRYGGAYAQDTWKVKPNLTLNLGLRWEVSSPWYDTQGKIQTWVPGKQSVVFPGSPKGPRISGRSRHSQDACPYPIQQFRPTRRSCLFPWFSRRRFGKDLRRARQNQHPCSLWPLLHLSGRSELVLRGRRCSVWLVLDQSRSRFV